MSVRLTASDLDGTLMSPDHMTVSERTKKALSAAHEKGIKIAVSTGRAYKFTKPATDQVPFTDYVICSNGASVFDRNEEKFIYSNLISPEVTNNAAELLSSLNVYYNIYMDGGVYVQKGCERFFSNGGLPIEFIMDFASKTTVCDDMTKTVEGKGAELIDVFYNDEETRKTVFDFFERNGLVLTSALSGVVSATAKNSDKGTALKNLCDITGIKAEETMAFGDASNDSTMLAFAGYSFAMENGDDICKSSAKFIAPSNAEDGVAQMIEKYALNGE